MPMKLFDRTIGLLQRSLDVRTFRHQVLSNNISNSATSNYQSMDIPFQKILERSFHPSSTIHLKNTHPGHFPEEDKGGNELEASAERVNLDEEMAKLAENNLMFQAGVQALVKKLEALKIALIEGGK